MYLTKYLFFDRTVLIKTSHKIKAVSNMNSYLYILFYKKLTPVWSKKKKKIMKVTLNTIFIKLDIRIIIDKWNIKAKLDKYNSCSQKFYPSKNNYFIFILKNYILNRNSSILS